MRSFLVALAAPVLLTPAYAEAQINLSGISINDVQRMVGIARVIAGMSRSTRTASSDARRTAATASAAVRTGDEYVGVPYVWGGTTPRGFDCSGFVQYVYRQNGVDLPRTSRQMANAGRAVLANIGGLLRGDLMLFSGRTSKISHVALYVGDGRILHSSSSGKGVRYDDLRSTRGKYYMSHFVAARRLVENGRALVMPVESLTSKVPFDYFDPPDDAPKPVSNQMSPPRGAARSNSTHRPSGDHTG